MRPPRPHLPWLFAAVLALCALRLIHLGADTPRELTSWSLGVFVDEGYKTIDARNQTLFGAARWHPGDDYAGWVGRSPLTHWPFRAAFEALGPELSSARLVTVLWFGALLCLFTATMRRAPPWLTLLGLVLLGTQHTLFFFSRAALFEVPVALCLYGFLFAAAARPHLGFTLPAFVFAVALASFGIKASAPTYFAPVALGLLVAEGARYPRRSVAAATILALPLAATAWIYREVWSVRVDFALPEVPGRLLGGTLMHSSAPLVALGVLSALHALWTEPRRYLESPYRAGLLALVLIGPLAIGLFSYRPLRYFVPLLPAFLLFPIEWVRMGTWRAPLMRRVPWTRALVPIAAGVLLGLSSARDAAVLGRFFTGPSYRAQQTAAALERELPPAAVVAGDWAPLLTLGTPLRALYSNPRINPVGRFDELRPDYYVFATAAPWSYLGLPDPRVNLRRRGWLVEPPVLESSYAGRSVLVYPLDYGERGQGD